MEHELTTFKVIMMLGTCVIVTAAMGIILVWFLKKLKKIEIDFWGENASKVGGVQTTISTKTARAGNNQTAEQPS